MAMIASYTLQDWSNIATTAMGALAGIALVAAAAQIILAKAIQKEATAKEIFSGFLEQSLQYPHLLSPRDADIDLSTQTLRGSRDEFLQYETYIDLMMTAFENIYEMFGERRDWRDTMTSYFDWHRKYLQSDAFTAYESGLNPRLAEFLHSHLARAE